MALNQCIGWDDTGLVECRLLVNGANGTLTVVTNLPETVEHKHRVVICADVASCVLLAYLMTENEIFMGVLNNV